MTDSKRSPKTPPTGSAIVERARAGASHVEHGRLTPRPFTAPVAPREPEWEDGPEPGPSEPAEDDAAPTEQFEGPGLDTGVIAMQLEAARGLPPQMIEPMARVYAARGEGARSHRQTAATVVLGSLVREIMANNAEREREDKARDERERENRRKGRQALLLAIISGAVALIPTLIMIRGCAVAPPPAAAEHERSPESAKEPR